MLNAPWWKLHSTISPSTSPSDSNPGPCVQWVVDHAITIADLEHRDHEVDDGDLQALPVGNISCGADQQEFLRGSGGVMPHEA